MQIQVLGSGCPTCKKLYELTKKAAIELGIVEEVEYITDVTRIIELGVMSSPVLTVNGKVAMVGFTPSLEKIKDLLQKNTSSPCSCGGSC